MQESEKPEGAHRCQAYKECAYWAFGLYELPEDDSRMWLCTQCGIFHEKSGWVRVHLITDSEKNE